jgi:Cu/Ag efflux protein CusF
MARRTLVLVAASILGLSACGYVPVCHAADADQEQQEPSRSATFGMSATATVKAIDPATRTVTLTNTDGEDVDVKCGKQVRNFDQLKVGDKIRAAAFVKLTATMGNEGIGAEGADATTIIRTPEGGEPGAMIIRTKLRPAKIDAIDTTNRTVTLASMDGEKTRQVNVAKDLDLSKLKVGDEITLRVTRGVAIWEPQAEGARPAAGQLPGEGQGETMERGSATVTAVDAATGKVTIQTAQGKQRDIQMRPGSENLDRIKVGDKVGAMVVPEMAIAINKAGMEAQDRPGMEALEAKGARPGILLSDVDEVKGKVQSVDAASHSITITDADGDPKTLRTAPRVDLSDFKAGDDITARVTQVVAIKVENQQ